MDLPPEILCQILACLPAKWDIKQMRLANKALAIASAPFVFDSVQLTATTEDLQRARMIHGHFNHLLKTIVVVPVAYVWLAEPTYGWKMSDLSKQQVRSEYSHESHLRHRFDTSHRLGVESEHIISDQSIQKLFIELLEAPKLQRLVITDTYSPRRASWWLHAECCPRPESCSKSRAFHKRLRVLPKPLPPAIIPQLFHSLLRTAGVSKKIKEISITSSSDQFSWVYNTLQIPVVGAYHGPLALTGMTSLTLNFGYSSLGGARPPRYKEGQIGCLPLASNLEHLSVDMGAAALVFYERLDMTYFQFVFKRCVFGKLRSLELSNFSSTADELCALLSSSPKLQTLKINNHSLTSGLWYEIIEQLAERLSLAKVTMENIRGGFDERWITDRWSDLFGEINAYLLGDAPNPFSLERLSIWEDKKAAFQAQKRGCLWASWPLASKKDNHAHQAY